VTSFGLHAAAVPFDVAGQRLQHGDVLEAPKVHELHAAGVVWDTAQGWFVNRRVAFKPATPAGFTVVDLTRLH
jgi:hypothetical protein